MKIHPKLHVSLLMPVSAAPGSLTTMLTGFWTAGCPSFYWTVRVMVLRSNRGSLAGTFWMPPSFWSIPTSLVGHLEPPIERGGSSTPAFSVFSCVFSVPSSRVCVVGVAYLPLLISTPGFNKLINPQHKYSVSPATHRQFVLSILWDSDSWLICHQRTFQSVFVIFICLFCFPRAFC